MSLEFCTLNMFGLGRTLVGCREGKHKRTARLGVEDVLSVVQCALNSQGLVRPPGQAPRAYWLAGRLLQNVPPLGLRGLESSAKRWR